MPDQPFSHDDEAASGQPDVSARWADLDEYFCEYVDGTMDAATRAAFEEVLEADPGARAHAEALQRTRMMLGGCPCAARAPRDLRHRLHGHLATEMTCGRGSAVHSARWIGAGVMLASLIALGVLALTVHPAEPEVARAQADPPPRYQAPIRARAMPVHIARPMPWPSMHSAKPVRINAAPLPMTLRHLDARAPSGVPSPSALPAEGTSASTVRLPHSGL